VFYQVTALLASALSGNVCPFGLKTALKDAVQVRALVTDQQRTATAIISGGKRKPAKTDADPAEVTSSVSCARRPANGTKPLAAYGVSKLGYLR
jgi:hypothetical protein